MTKSPPNVAVLISGRGSNLLALLDAQRAGRLDAAIVGVLSNQAQAGGLEHARSAGLPHAVVPHGYYADRPAFEHVMAGIIDAWKADLVVLSGFMRVLTDDFVNRYAGRLINQHPSLLPAYPGLRTHERAVADGVAKHGASIHFVTPELDGGPVIMQASVTVAADDTPARLGARILPLEHRMVVDVVNLWARGRIAMSDAPAGVLLDGQRLSRPLELDANYD